MKDWVKTLVIFSVLTLSMPAIAIPETQVSHRPGDFIQSIQNDPAAGRKIYQEFCASCHAPQPRIHVGAPRLQNPIDWQAYAQIDLSTLLKMADVGSARMPPRGGCFECSDDNLKAAIEYMLPAKKNSKAS